MNRVSIYDTVKPSRGAWNTCNHCGAIGTRIRLEGLEDMCRRCRNMWLSEAQAAREGTNIKK